MEQYEILECWTKAKSLNPLGEEPEKFPAGWLVTSRIWDRWKSAEDSRVTYEIERLCTCSVMFYYCENPHTCLNLNPKQIVQGEIINGKIRII